MAAALNLRHWLMRNRKTSIAALAALAATIAYQQRKKRGRSSRSSRRTRSATSSSSTSSKPRLPKATLADILRILIPQLNGPAGRRILALAVLTGINTYLSDRTALLQGQIFRSVFTQAKADFFWQIIETVVLQLGTSVLKSTTKFLVHSMGCSWRDVLYTDLHKYYFKAMTYYRTAFVDKRITTPEEVLCNDIPALTDGLSIIAKDIMSALFDGAFFTVRLAQQTSLGWSVVTWAYVVFAVGLVRMLSPNFGKMFSTKSMLGEAFNKAMGRVVTHCEAIAALHGEDREASLVNSAFTRLKRQIDYMIKQQWSFGMIEDFVTKYAASTTAMIVILGPFFGGNLRTDYSAEGNAQTLASMRYVTSVIISQLTAIAGLARCLRKLATVTSYAKRVGGMRKVLVELNESQSEVGSLLGNGDCIEFKGVTVQTPAGDTLVRDLCFRVEPGKNLLITGPNGAGKSSIFRCLGTLWSITEGEITRPGGSGQGLHDSIFYLPQKPYNVVGKLRDQVTYPRTLSAEEQADELPDAKLRQLLQLVGLEYMMESHADQVVNWEATFSLGETQRLAIARLFFHNPMFAILDECTSAVNQDMERRLYRLCAERNITCITISHRPALVAFHDLKLELVGDGTYNFEQIIHEAQPQHLDSLADASTGASVSSAFQEEKNSAELTETTETSSFPPLVGSQRRQLSKFQRLIKLVKFFVPALNHKSTAILLKLLGVVGIRVFLSDRVAHLNGETVRLLLLDDLPGFKRLVGISLLQCVASSIMAPSLHYYTKSLSLLWRTKLQEHLNTLFFKNKTYYKLICMFKSGDNVEQRLTQDIDRFCLDLANLFPEMIKPIVDLIWFSARSGVLIGVKQTAMLYLYMLFSLTFLRAVTPDFAQLTSRRSTLDGQFRFIQRRLRVHAESVAFFGGNEKEGSIAMSAFQDTVSHYRSILRKQWLYDVADDFVVKQLPPIATWVLSLLYANQISPDASYQQDVNAGGQLGHDLRFVASAVSHIFTASGELVQTYKRMQEISGYARQLGELEEDMSTYAAPPMPAIMPAANTTVSTAPTDEDQGDEGDGASVDADIDCISFQDASIVTPSGTVLLEKLAMTIAQDEPMLITGPNTSGKTSLVRVIGRLWPLRDGTLVAPNAADTSKLFLVPQKPYCPTGTLADQLTYPQIAPLTDENQLAKLAELMEKVHLGYLVERHGWDARQQWEDVLSLGEQQRIGMARLFFHAPKFAVLDQCTDAVSVEMENTLYQEAERLGITIITTSTRAALTTHHAKELVILGSGKWKLNTMTPEDNDVE
eukprot:m.144576 g.144576  ORF g.144576 m.144576 type:complete len:1291 (-) comp14133_c0_seq3:1306-5178(-)